MSAKGESSGIEKPVVYNYLDFRKFLEDMVLFLRSHQKYSSRRFAEVVGFSSPSYLKMIVDGKRNLTVEKSKQLAQAFELSADDSRFFEKLVHFGQLKHPEIKKLAFEDLMRFKKFRQIHTLTQAEFDFYKEPARPILYEMIGHCDVLKNKEGISKEIGLSLDQFDQALIDLELLGLIQLKNGEWVKTNVGIRTRHETSSINVRNFQKTMIEKATEALDELPAEERDFQTLTLALSKEEFQNLKKMIYSFLGRTNQRFSNAEKPDAIYQMNMQFFPLAELPKKKD